MFHTSNISKAINSIRDNLAIAINRRLSTTTNNMSAASSQRNKSALIFLHGLGDQGSSWQSELKSILPPNTECICPTAPVQPVTLNLGMRMPAWFNLKSLDPNDAEDESGIQSASKSIHALIAEQEQKGVPHDRILVGGFSQGGALALYSAFTYPKKLAGVLALSCWLPLHKKVPQLITEPNKSIPILYCHGNMDSVVPLPWAQLSTQIMSTFHDKTKVNFKVYDASHGLVSEELQDMEKFVKDHLP